jgi:hypothetical protein
VICVAAMSFDPLTSARDRAFQLAQTGDCRNWPEIAWQLVSEGYSSGAVIALGADSAARAALADVLLETLGHDAAYA